MAKHYNFIYEELVRYEGDLVGRVAYSLYKREKIAFIEQYKKSHEGKEPTTRDFDNFHASCHNPEVCIVTIRKPCLCFKTSWENPLRKHQSKSS